MTNVRLIGPAESPHTQLWITAFRAAGVAVDGVSVSPARPLRFIREVVRGWAQWLRSPCTLHGSITIVHSMGTHGLLSLMLPATRSTVLVPWGSEVSGAMGSAMRHVLASLMLRRADLVLVTSMSMASRLADGWPRSRSPVKVVSWGVSKEFLGYLEDHTADDPRRYLLGLGEADTVILSPRGRGPTYREDEIVRSFMTAKASRPELRLIMIGSESGALTDAKVVGDVMYLPRLPKRDLAFVMRSVDAVVSVPSADQRSTTVLEAAAAGVTLMLSDIPANRELVESGVHALLIKDPLEDGLAAEFAVVSRRSPGSVRENIQFIQANESQERQMSLIVDLCMDLANAH